VKNIGSGETRDTSSVVGAVTSFHCTNKKPVCFQRMIALYVFAMYRELFSYHFISFFTQSHPFRSKLSLLLAPSS
jgi:hypothetical protein